MIQKCNCIIYEINEKIELNDYDITEYKINKLVNIV